MEICLVNYCNWVLEVAQYYILVITTVSSSNINKGIW